VSIGLVGLTAAVLLVSTFARLGGWAWLGQRSGRDWLLDGSGLVIQGLLVPVLQATVLYVALARIVPAWQGCLPASAWGAFALNVVAVDYAYYWNHRLLHRAGLWRWHAVHHTATRLDVLVTARNTVLSHFLILYVWINALGAFLLADPTGFLFGAACTAALDLWRHSELAPRGEGAAGRLVRLVLITPVEHAWHHSRTRPDCNFGANLCWWDRLHGTYYRPGRPPERLGVGLGWSFLQKLVLPARAVRA
jgi:sterol desaturase/sphingolipid hydroxylase (fatty acid hydroxylase superfamily)